MFLMKKNAESYRIKSMNWLDNQDDNHNHRKVLDDAAMGIVNMGIARDCRDAIAKVQIRIGQDASEFRLYADPNKLKDLTMENIAGVFWHELNHVLHRHLAMNPKDSSLGMPDSKKLTIAQEIVCNDTVLHYGIQLPYMNMDTKDGIFFGEKIVGKNTFGLSTKEVYDLLTDEVMENFDNMPDGEGGNSGEKSESGSSSGSGDNGENDGQSSGSSGESGENDDKKSGSSSGSGDNGENGENKGESSGSCGGIEIVDQDGNPVDISSLDQEELQDILDQITDGLSDLEDNIPEGDKSQMNSPSKQAGNGGGLGNRGIEMMKEHNISADWLRFLKKMDPEVHRALTGLLDMTVPRANWTKKPTYMYASGNNYSRLPVYEGDKNPRGFNGNAKPVLIIAVDQSGSIGKEVADRARHLATTIPRDKVDVRACVFGDRYSEMDVDSGRIKNDHGYGTDFSAIDNFVKECGYGNRKDISILVFTDGYASFNNGNPVNIGCYHWIDLFKQKDFDETMRVNLGLSEVKNVHDVTTLDKGFIDIISRVRVW